MTTKEPAIPTTTALTAEENLIGVILLDPTIATDAAILDPGDFEDPRHGVIFEAILTLVMDGFRVDPVSVAEMLRSDGTLDAVGGPGRLLQLQAQAPATFRAPEFIAEIWDRAAFRGIERALAHTHPHRDGIYRPARVSSEDDTSNPLVTIEPIPRPADDVSCVAVNHIAGDLGEVWTVDQARQIALALLAACRDAERAVE